VDDILFRVNVVVSLLRCVLCLIVPSLSVGAEPSWGGWQSGGTGWSGALAFSAYYGCYGYGYYPYYADSAAIIRLTGSYGYVPHYSYGCGHPNICGGNGRGHLYATVRGVRHVRTYGSAAAVSSSGSVATGVPSPPAKKVEPAPAGSASAKGAWTPLTVPSSPSAANEPPKAATEEAGRTGSDWAKKLELKLNKLSPDMSAASALLVQEGFRVDSGNKSATGWFLTAHDIDQLRGSVKLESDGTKIVLTVTG
jgi:hypothetical protein